jgi:hypothetical protein
MLHLFQVAVVKVLLKLMSADTADDWQKLADYH